MVVIVDGIDEAVGWSFGAGFFPYAQPSGQKILVSARELAGHQGPQGWIDHLNWDSFHGLAEGISLKGLTGLGIKNLFIGMGAPLSQLAANDQIVSEIERLTEGAPLLIRLYAEDLGQLGNQVSLLRLEDLPTMASGYRGYLGKWLQDQRKLWHGQSPLDRRENRLLLAVLATAKGFLSRVDIRQVLQRCLPRFDGSIRGGIEAFQRFIVGVGSEEEGYVLSHVKLAEFFLSSDFLELDDAKLVSEAFLSWGAEVVSDPGKTKSTNGLPSRYLVQFYGIHLEESAPDRLITLVSELWRRGWEQVEGGWSGFATDIQRAWDYARRVNIQAACQGELVRLPRLADEIRCALRMSSLFSQNKHISEDLIALAVEVGEWTPRQALDLIRLDPDPGNRGYRLACFKARFEVKLAEILKCMSLVIDERRRSMVVQGIARELPDSDKSLFIDAMWPSVNAISNRNYRADALIGLMRYGRTEQRVTITKAVFELTRTVVDEDDRAYLLERLARELPDTESGAFLTEVRSIKELKFRWRPLRTLLSRLSPARAASLVDESRLTFRAAHPELDEVHWLTEVLPYLCEVEKLRVAAQVLSVARKLSDADSSVEIIGRILPYLPESERSDVASATLEAALVIANSDMRMRVVAELQPHIAGEAKQRACIELAKFARSRSEADECAMWLTSAVQLATPAEKTGLIAEALVWARAIGPGELKVKALRRIIPQLEKSELDVVIGEIQAVARGYPNGSDGANVLLGLAEYLDLPNKIATIREALTAARAICDQRERASVLSSLAGYLPDAERQSVAQEAEYLSNVENERLRNTGKIVQLLPYLSETERAPLVAQALASARAVESALGRAEAIVALLPFLEESEASLIAAEGLATARMIESSKARSQIVRPFIEYLPVAERTQVLIETFMWDSSAVWKALQMVSCLPEDERTDFLQTALAVSRLLPDRDMRPQVLIDLLPLVPRAERATLLEEILATADEADFKLKAEAIMQFAASASGIEKDIALERSISAIRAVPDLWWRASLYSQLVPLLPSTLIGGILEEARVVASSIGGSKGVEVLFALLPFVPNEHRQVLVKEVLAAARTLGSPIERIGYLTTGATRLPASLQLLSAEILIAVLSEFPSIQRGGVLRRVRLWLPTIRMLGGAQAITGTLAAVRDVGNWWP